MLAALALATLPSCFYGDFNIGPPDLPDLDSTTGLDASESDGSSAVSTGLSATETSLDGASSSSSGTDSGSTDQDSGWSCVDALDGAGCTCDGAPAPTEFCSYACEGKPAIFNDTCVCTSDGIKAIDDLWCDCSIDINTDQCACSGLIVPDWFCAEPPVACEATPEGCSCNGLEAPPIACGCTIEVDGCHCGDEVLPHSWCGWAPCDIDQDVCVCSDGPADPSACGPCASDGETCWCPNGPGPAEWCGA